MPVFAGLSGFPPILKLTFNEVSDARPGRCVVETPINGPVNVSELPRHATLTIRDDAGFNGVWQEMRVVKASRARQGVMRVVLEDQRWKLWDAVMNRNFNQRSPSGSVLTGTAKLVSELVDEIQQTTGISITNQWPAANQFYPPAKWTNRSAGECLQQLLHDTASRLVYSPTTSQYYFSPSGTAGPIDRSLARFEQVPGNKFSKVNFRSSPILYEDTLDCTAKEINKTTGDLQALSTSTIPTSPTEDYGQTRYRLWEPNSVTHPSNFSNSDVVYFGHRAMHHTFDPKHPLRERARIVRDEFERYPHHEGFVSTSGTTVELMEVTGGGKAFIAEHPVLISSGGALQSTCKLVTSYYVRDGSDFKRESVTKTVNGSGGEKTETIDWIQPVSSTLPDVASSTWQAVLNEAATERARAYSQDPETLISPAFIDLNGNGNVGGVRYEMRAGFRFGIRFSAAINFTPGSQGDIA